MTSLYRSQEIDYVKMTLKAREGASIKTLWLSNRFYEPESIFGFKAGYLDGDDYWSRADNAALSTGNIDFSVSAWVKLDSLGSAQVILGKGDFSSANQGEYRIFVYSTGELGVAFETGAATQGFAHSETLSAGRWYFICVVHDAASDLVTITIDDREESFSYSAGSWDSGGPFTIGKMPNDTIEYYTGYICNVGFWKKALSEDERGQLYNLGTGLNYDDLSGSLLTSLTAWWNCDDGASTISDNASTNDLTATGGTATGNGPGNQPICPALLSLPQVGFALGPVTAEQIDTQLVINAFLSLGNNSETFASLLKSYEVSGQTLEIYYVSKAPDEYLMQDADFPSLRQTLEMQSYDLNEDDGTITITCYDRWFKDQKIEEIIDVTTFPNAADVELGKFKGFLWGGDNVTDESEAATLLYTPLIDASWIDITTDNPHSGNTKAASKLLYAQTLNDFESYEAVIYDYAYNNDAPNSGGQTWQRVFWRDDIDDSAIDGPSNSDTLNSTSNSLSLVTFPVIARSFTVSVGYISTGFRILLQDLNNSIVDADGPIRVQLCTAELVNGTNLFIRQVLREKDIAGGDSRISGTAAVLTEVWDEPCVLAPNKTTVPTVRYALVVRWIRDDAAGGTDIFNLFYSGSGTDYLYSESFGNDDFLTKSVSAVGLQLALDGAWSEATDIDTGGASQEYVSRTVWGRYSSAQTNPILFETLQMRALFKGLRDFSPAVHSGSANSLLTNPVSIISSMLNSPSAINIEDVGKLGFDSARDAYDALADESNSMSVVITSPTNVTELVLKICEVARIRLVKLRNGKLVAKWSANFDESSCTEISEALHRSNLSIVSLSETDPSQIVNDFKAFYKRDPESRQRERKEILRVGSDQFIKSFVLNATTSTDSDAVREALLEESISLYGRKEWRREIEYYVYTEPVRRLVNYFADRYAFKQKRATVRLLKREFFDLFLRDQIDLKHTKLSGSSDFEDNYTRDYDRLKLIDEDYAGVTFTGGAAVSVYSSGIPQTLLALGTLQGEIVAIQEQGPFLYLTIETMGSFLEVPFIEGDYD